MYYYSEIVRYRQDRQNLVSYTGPDTLDPFTPPAPAVQNTVIQQINQDQTVQHTYGQWGSGTVVRTNNTRSLMSRLRVIPTYGAGLK